MSNPFTQAGKTGVHSDNALSWALRWLHNKFFLATVEMRPSTVTIYNVSTAGAGWTAIATGLTNVKAWKLTEESGNAFRYCFDGVGATYMTTFGSLQRDSEITAVYAQRLAAPDIDLQLEVWV